MRRTPAWFAPLCLAALVLAVASPAGAATFTPPAPLDFGAVAVGSTSAPLTVTIQGATFPGGFDVISDVALVPGSPFAITNTDCNAVPAPTSCHVTMTFTPTGAGAVAGTLAGTETNPATGGASAFSYGLTGTGTAPPPVLPEAPAPWVLPLVAAALFGASFLVLRRRATAAALQRGGT